MLPSMSLKMGVTEQALVIPAEAHAGSDESQGPRFCF
jgi:hypothetical protein